jgi:chromate transporter
MLKLIGDIFTAFFKIGLLTLGGGLAIISLVQQEMLSRGWLTNEQFLDILGVAQMTPGPIGVNTATFVGYRVASLQGFSEVTAVAVALFATVSVVLPSIVGVHFGGGWFNRNRDQPWVVCVFSVLRPLVAGFVTAAGVTLALDCFGVPDVRSFDGLAFSWVSGSVCAGTCLLALTNRFSPLWGLGAGALLGAFGLF